jgi:GNAT superfamily N-acetyltransferase
LGRPAEVVAHSIETSLCFGVYAPAGEQVGFARAVTDYATFAWLCDVYIAPDARGAGLGTWLVRTAQECLAEHGVRRILLATADAHGLYASIGFVPLSDPGRWMEMDPRSQRSVSDAAPR